MPNLVGHVLFEQKINQTSGGFSGPLDDGDQFGAVANLGDLDGDGTTDLAVGAHRDDDGGLERGAVWILFLNPNGTVKSHQKISSTEGGFTGSLDDDDRFGGAVASLGDLDGDGTTDLAVGAVEDDDGGIERGAVWVLFLNPNGTVKSHQKISSTEGGFTGSLDDGDFFSSAVSTLGDLDEDGTIDLAVGASRDDDGGDARGAVWILFLNPDGTVDGQQKISSTEGGFAGSLDDIDLFGSSTTPIGDLDRDGIIDLVVGAAFDDDGEDAQGAVWVLFLNADGTVKGHQKISATEGGFTGHLDSPDKFGWSTAGLRDLNCDGSADLAVGAVEDSDGGALRGAVWILFLAPDGTVRFHTKISSTSGGLNGPLNDADYFGSGVTSLGDFDGDGNTDLAVGAFLDDGQSGTDQGAIWNLMLDGGGCFAIELFSDGFESGDTLEWSDTWP